MWQDLVRSFMRVLSVSVQTANHNQGRGGEERRGEGGGEERRGEGRGGNQSTPIALSYCEIRVCTI